MRYILFILLLVYSSVSFGRIQFGPAFTLLTGSIKTGDHRAVLNYAEPAGAGMAFTFDGPVSKNIYIGASLNLANGKLRKSALESDFVTSYMGDYYNSIGQNYSTGADWTISQVAFTISRVFYTDYADFEPVLLLGVGDMSSTSTFVVDRKKMNEHYTETVSIRQATSGVGFYPGIGGKVSKHISGRWYFNAGVIYRTGKMNYTTLEKTIDFWDIEQPEVEYNFSRSISSIQFMLGLQLKFRDS